MCKSVQNIQAILRTTYPASSISNSAGSFFIGFFLPFPLPNIDENYYVKTTINCAYAGRTSYSLSSSTIPPTSWSPFSFDLQTIIRRRNMTTKDNILGFLSLGVFNSLLLFRRLHFVHQLFVLLGRSFLVLDTLGDLSLSVRCCEYQHFWRVISNAYLVTEASSDSAFTKLSSPSETTSSDDLGFCFRTELVQNMS